MAGYKPTVLLVSEGYDNPTLNRQVAQIPVVAGANVYCAVLQASREEQEKAQGDGVMLILPVQRTRDPRPPTLDWLTYDHIPRYPDLPKDVNCIVGHADITDTAARNIKDDRYPQADLITVTHVIPEDTEYYKGGRKAMKARDKEKDMLDKVDNAKAAFSVGMRIYLHFHSKYKGGKRPQSHHMFLPKPSKIFLDANVIPGGWQKVVLSIGRVRKVEKLKGHDLVGESMREVVKIIKNVHLRVRGISEDDWENSKKILEDALNSPDLNPTLLPYGTQEEIRDDMMTAHLVLMPSHSEPFGLVGLEAIAAGIPVLISDKTGLAEMILDLIRQKKLSAEHRNVIVETSVSDRDRAGDARGWAVRIVDVLQHNDSEFEKAARFKQELVASRYWEESHNAFLQACTNTASDPIELAMADPEMRALYNLACEEGTHNIFHIMLMLVGKERNGKSSLKNSLLRLKFNTEETITEGIEITQCLKTQEGEWKVMKGKRDADLSDVVGSKERPAITIWDFAGHEIFYSNQHVLYSPHAIYILTLDLTKSLDAPLEEEDQPGSRAEALQLKTEGDLVDYHLESIRAHTRLTGVPDHEPHVIVVGTHKDQVSQEMIESLFKNLRDHLDGKAVNELVHDRYFAIDNTKSDPEDPELSYLRAFILDIAQNQSHMGREIPISWLELKSELMKMEKQGTKYCSLQDVIDATGRSRVPEGYTPEENAVIFLKFLHLSRDILYFDTPGLRNFVVLDPQWFVDVQKTIITIPEYRLDGKKSQWDRLEKEGVLEDTLVDAVWGNKKKQEDLRCDLIAYKNELLKMMEQFDLVLQCSPDSDDETGTATSYFVPSLLTATMVEAKLFPKGPKRSKPIFVVFNDKFFPIGLYHRLVIDCMRRYKRKPPLAYANCARFVTDNRKQNFVITKERHYFKVELLSSVKEESDCFSHGPAVREGMDEDLRRIIDDWIPGIGYKWCFCCCCQEHKKKQEEERLTPIMDEDEVKEWFEEGKAVCDEFAPATTAIEDIGLTHWYLNPEVPVEVKLRGPKMARLYADACRQGSLPVYSTRVPVVGQFRSGKTCFIKRLMGETVSGDPKEKEPITDGINIISDVQTKTYKKSQAEIDDLAGQMLRKETRHSAEEKNKKETSKKKAKWAPEDTRKVVPVEQERGQNFDEEMLSVRQDLPTATTEESIKVEDQEKQESEKTNSKTATTEDPTKEHHITEQEKNASDRQTEDPSQMEGKAPDHVIENAARMMEAGIKEDELGTAEHPRLSFWDFGGQATYYGTHHCFITHRGVYILVMSLEQKLSEDVRDLDYKASVDNLRTGGDYLDHWLNTVRSQTLQHETRDPEGSQAAGQGGPQSSSQDKTSRRTGRPPVIIVLTHKDKRSQEYIEKYKEEIRSHVKGKAAGKLVMPEIFAVDNTTEDAAVDEIRDYIRQVARGLPHMGEEVPIQWLHLNSKLKIKRKEGPFCKFREVAELARDPDINITDRHTLALVLTFLHDRGDIIFFDEPSLCDDVILQPQVLIDVFKTIITDPQYQQNRKTDPKMGKMWKKLEKEGVLSDEFLTRIWEEKDRELEKPFLMYPDVLKMFESWLEQEGVLSNNLLTRIWEKRSHQLQKPFLLQNKSFLKALMEKFYLICNATPVGDASDEALQEEIYFVPALLSCERDNAKLYPKNMHICPEALYFVFSEQFLPSGMFSRLQAMCVRRFGLQESCVFAGCARFPTDDKEHAFVITKVNHYLKVELMSSSNIFTEGLQIRKFLSSALFEIKEKWIPCIQYELCCSSQQEDGGEPAFRTLPTEYRSLEQLEGIPSVFRAAWMPGGYQRDRTGRDNPVILHPIGDPDTFVGMRTIGPVLDTMEQGGGLTLDQCDHIRNQLTPIQRVLDMRRQGEVDPYQLGAAVEMCCPEFVDLFTREKRGKELVILHADDYTAEFVLPLQTAARESGLPCHTEVITGTDSITEKTVQRLLKTKNRMVALVISPQTLHHKHWTNLAYEFPVRNEKLLLPILLYPKGYRDRMFKVLQQRSPVLHSLACEEIEMEGRDLSEVKLQEIIRKVLTDKEMEFQLILERIFSRLDETDVRKLLRVWSARTGQQESAGIERPQDLKRAMVKSGYITTGDLGMVEKDMMAIATGISFPVIVRDIPEVPDELRDRRTSEAPVGPEGGEVEIPGFVKLVVPQGVLHRETTITVSTVDIPGILRGDEGVSWTSGYPWSLGEDACPRELLDQVLFSPAVDINLHGARLSGPLELETWRPPGSEGMECVILKHHDGQGWTDITATTLHHIGSDKLSVFLSNFSALGFVWTKVKAVANDMLDALLSRTLDCRFAGYIKPHEEGVEFHVVCRDQSVETDEEEYLPDFTKCRTNDAEFYLYHDDRIEVAVAVDEGKGPTKKVLGRIRADHCRRAIGQSFQTRLKRSSGKPVNGVVVVTKFQEQVCQFSFWEEDTVPSNLVVYGPAVPPGTDPAVPPGTGPAPEGFEGPVILFINDEYGTSKGGISTINCGASQTLQGKAVVYCTVLQLEVPKQDQEAADRDEVKLVTPVQPEGDAREPSIDWLTFDYQIRYPKSTLTLQEYQRSRHPKSTLPPHVDVIIGHADITDTAARNIHNAYYKDEADLIMFTHVLREDTEHYKGVQKAKGASKKEEDMLDKVDNAKAAFSVGKRIFEHFESQYMGDKEPQDHMIFLPKPSQLFLDIKQKSRRKGELVVLSIGRVRNAERLKGHDLVGTSMGEVVKIIKKARWRVRGISEDDWKKSLKILEDALNSPDLRPTLLPYGTQEDIRNDMMKAHLVVMPSRSEPFGLVGLEAIAAGIPVLISNQTGLAEMILDLIRQNKLSAEHRHIIVETDVRDRDRDDDTERDRDRDDTVKRWAKRIVDILQHSDSEFEKAASLKRELMESRYWEESHNAFLQACGVTTGAADQ